MVKRCKGRVRQSHTCQVPVAVRAPKLHKKHTVPQSYLWLCCWGFKGAFDIREYRCSIADNSSLNPFIYAHEFSDTNALWAVPRAQSSLGLAHKAHRLTAFLYFSCMYIAQCLYLYL